MPGGILAFSGFLPSVEGRRPELAGRAGLRTVIAHGRQDAVIEIAFARSARRELEAGGLQVDYHESDAAHQIDPAQIPAAVAWLGRTLPL